MPYFDGGDRLQSVHMETEKIQDTEVSITEMGCGDVNWIQLAQDVFKGRLRY
jgi:hypothetical protein